MNKPISSHAHAAKLIRAELKRRGYKASVRSSSYSMGSSVHVHIYEDLRPEVVEEIQSWCGQFQYGHFDGMVDLYEYSNRRDDLPQVKFVLVQVHYSAEAHAYARSWTYREEDDTSAEWLALSRNYGNFWDRFEEHKQLEARLRAH